jgi:hypothetical protein
MRCRILGDGRPANKTPDKRNEAYIKNNREMLIFKVEGAKLMRLTEELRFSQE